MSIKLNVKNEYDTLKVVLMASVKSFRIHPPINKTQEYFYLNDPPKLRLLVEQQEAFACELKKHDVEILWVPSRADCTNQINTRDVGFAIGNTFVISPMAKQERRNEHIALEEAIKSFSGAAIHRPTDGIIEGGDIVVDNSRIFVGISERTNWKGYDWLKTHYGEKYEIMPIELNERYLHLDVVFNILSSGHVLINPTGIKKKYIGQIEKLFSVIAVDDAEQDTLATNIFSINPNLIVCDERNIRTNASIERTGKELIPLRFDEITKIGGSFRCGTCPLIREEK